MASIEIKTAVPGPRSQAVFAERAKHVAPGPFHTTPIVAERAEGVTITDVDGNTFLDFACGIGVTNLGHCEPSVVSAAKAQADKFFHTSINV
ncbi:MAG: aminotransferase class III-fold pyridoxal phosphate-dependent enzyme, partial [Chthoniobacterales bacterium]